jgi:RNA polymerase sigma factor (sigma-70 family)
MIEDKLLILKCKRGSTDALQRIYQKYKDDLLVLAMAILNDAGAAEDALHDVFVRFVEELAGFRLTGSLKAYLATCVANRARNISRQRKAVGLEQTDPAGPQSNQPDRQIVCNEQLQLLNHAMAELSFEQREVIMLHLRSGLTLRQIAESLEVSANTVKSRYRYGIDKLRQILKERDEK